MRTTNIYSSTVTYPDSSVFIYDNIFISVSDPVYPVGVELNITNMGTLETKTLKYVSELKNLTVDISDTVRRLHSEGGCTISCKVKVYTDLFYLGTFNFNMDTLDGRTLPYRSHGSARTFYVYSQDELRKFQLFLAGSGALFIGGTSIPVTGPGRNSYDMRPYVTQPGEYSACFKYGVKGGGGTDTTAKVEVTGVDPTCFSAVATLEYTDIDTQPVETEIKGGSVWNDSATNLADFCADIVYSEVCDDFDFFEISYYDTDGIMRYLGGRIQSETTSTGSRNYTCGTDSVYRDLSRRHIESAGATVKVAFPDIWRDAYPQDALLSEHVWFRTYSVGWLPCSISSNKITVKSEDVLDIELEIELLKQGQ